MKCCIRHSVFFRLVCTAVLMAWMAAGLISASQASEAPSSSSTTDIVSSASSAAVSTNSTGLERIYVRCGGQTYKDIQGRVFEADKPFRDGEDWGYIGGEVGSAPADATVAGTADPQLFLSERWGVKEYRFRMKPGVYRVTMCFNEAYFKAARRRVFDILINDRLVVPQLDIVGVAGPNAALEIVRTVATEDGWVVIGARDILDKAKFDAIAIEPAQADANPPAAPATVTVFPRSNAVGLEWTPVEAEDMAGYRVYRSVAEPAAWEPVSTGLLSLAWFLDLAVTNGTAVSYQVSAVDLFGNESAHSATVTATPALPPADQLSIGINVGGPACKDEVGRQYMADRAYTPANGSGYLLAGTDHVLSEKSFGEPNDSFQEGTLVYRFDLPEGVYRVTLGFMDPWSRRNGDRVFDVLLNGFRAVKDLDLVGEYGADGLPLQLQRVCRVSTNGLEVRLAGNAGKPVLTFLHAAPEAADLSAPAAPAMRQTVSRDEVVSISWDAVPEQDVIGYKVLKAEGEPSRIVSPEGGLWLGESFVDHDVENGKRYFYEVRAVDASGNESPSSARVTGEPKEPSDDELLDTISRAAFEFFVKECLPPAYLTKDKNVDGPGSIAAMGFGLSALCLGAERGWMDRGEAERRAYLMLRALNSNSKNKCQGLFYHYLDRDGGPSAGGYEQVISTIDSALLAWGAIAAGEYFGGRVKEEAALMTGRMNWKFFAKPQEKMIAMAYKPQGGRFDGAWDYYTDEAILITVLGASAPNPEFRLGPEYFYGFKRERKNYKDLKDIVITWPGALFTYTFAHCWLDFRTLGPDNPAAAGLPEELKTDWWDNTTKAVKANKEFCKFLAKRHPTYGENAWGLTACSGPDHRYVVCGSPPCGGAAEIGGGLLATYGAGMSVPFLPEDATAALRHYYTMRDAEGRKMLWRDEFDGGYGLVDSFNVSRDFVSDEVHGINHGPMLLLIENHRSGLLWKLCLKNKAIREGLQRIGFTMP